MAQITPPDYSKIATRQQVYNVRPAQEQYRGPDENAGQVDLSTAKIIDSVVNGLDVFTRIYAQSEETADTLQANEILVKQANYNQSVKEAIKFNVGKTAPEKLRMEGAVQKFRTTDKNGKSDLVFTGNTVDKKFPKHFKDLTNLINNLELLIKMVKVIYILAKAKE